MDFNLPESKPEVMRPINKDLVDRNKQDLLNFFNVSPKAKVAMAVSGLGVLLFFVSISTLSFQNATLNNLFPKQQSNANFQGQLPAHTPISGAGFLLSAVQTQRSEVPFDLEVQIRTATETASILTAQIKYDPAMLEIVSTNDQNSVATTWIDKTSNNTEGVLSLVSSFQKGIKVDPAAKYITITFKPKGSGQTTISVDKNSKIFRLSDKKEISIEYDSIPLVINP